MGTAASLFVNPAELDDLGAQPTAKALARRAKQRRQILTMIGASYVIDAGILLVYAEAGTIPVMVGPAYAATGLALVPAVGTAARPVVRPLDGVEMALAPPPLDGAGVASPRSAASSC